VSERRGNSGHIIKLIFWKKGKWADNGGVERRGMMSGQKIQNLTKKKRGGGTWGDRRRPEVGEGGGYEKKSEGRNIN